MKYSVKGQEYLQCPESKKCTFLKIRNSIYLLCPVATATRPNVASSTLKSSGDHKLLFGNLCGAADG